MLPCLLCPDLKKCRSMIAGQICNYHTIYFSCGRGLQSYVASLPALQSEIEESITRTREIMQTLGVRDHAKPSI
jgi:hypothetical protein